MLCVGLTASYKSSEVVQNYSEQLDSQHAVRDDFSVGDADSVLNCSLSFRGDMCNPCPFAALEPDKNWS